MSHRTRTVQRASNVGLKVCSPYHFSGGGCKVAKLRLASKPSRDLDFFVWRSFLHFSAAKYKVVSLDVIAPCTLCELTLQNRKKNRRFPEFSQPSQPSGSFDNI